jgi:hypothetical protein
MECRELKLEINLRKSNHTNNDECSNARQEYKNKETNFRLYTETRLFDILSESFYEREWRMKWANADASVIKFVFVHRTSS